MKLALISAWGPVRNAEFEFNIRFGLACQNIGIDAILVDATGNELDWKTGERVEGTRSACDVDFAIAAHFRFPKGFDVPHVYLNWNPPPFLKKFGLYWQARNIASFDFIAPFGSTELDTAISRTIPEDLRFLDTSFPPTANMNRSGLASSDSKSLFYCGINWERLSQRRGRFDAVLERIGETTDLRIYGPRHLNDRPIWDGHPNYVDEIDFDGESLVSEISRSGACLVMLSPEHAEFNCVSMRVFEALSAGSEIVCPRTGYLENLLGDHAFYYDTSGSEAHIAEQIGEAAALIEAGERRMSSEMISDYNARVSLEAKLEVLVAELESHFAKSSRKRAANEFRISRPLAEAAADAFREGDAVRAVPPTIAYDFSTVTWGELDDEVMGEPGANIVFAPFEYVWKCPENIPIFTEITRGDRPDLPGRRVFVPGDVALVCEDQSNARRAYRLGDGIPCYHMTGSIVASQPSGSSSRGMGEVQLKNTLHIPLEVAVERLLRTGTETPEFDFSRHTWAYMERATAGLQRPEPESLNYFERAESKTCERSVPARFLAGTSRRNDNTIPSPLLTGFSRFRGTAQSMSNSIGVIAVPGSEAEPVNLKIAVTVRTASPNRRLVIVGGGRVLFELSLEQAKPLAIHLRRIPHDRITLLLTIPESTSSRPPAHDILDIHEVDFAPVDPSAKGVSMCYILSATGHFQPSANSGALLSVGELQLKEVKSVNPFSILLIFQNVQSGQKFNVSLSYIESRWTFKTRLMDWLGTPGLLRGRDSWGEFLMGGLDDIKFDEHSGFPMEVKKICREVANLYRNGVLRPS